MMLAVALQHQTVSQGNAIIRQQAVQIRRILVRIAKQRHYLTALLQIGLQFLFLILRNIGYSTVNDNGFCVLRNGFLRQQA